jgi:CxxC motif-containing protein (DUF1111 family)
MAILGARAEAQASVNEDFTQPQPGLTSDQLTTFVAGKAQFEHEFTKKEGLGPLFNARACAACHHEPSVGGTGPRYRSNFDFGLQSGGGFDPLLGAGGPLLRQQALGGVARQTVPAAANVFSLRRVAALFGLGLVEAIPDQLILANADPTDVNKDGIKGQAVFTGNGRVQRFGSQAHVASLRAFVLKGFVQELGITPAEAQPLTLDQVRAFLLLLAPLPRGAIDNKVLQGEAVFTQLGCASCHVSSFVTAALPFTTADGEVVNVAALQNQTLHPYSDFLVHDLGPELDDGVSLGAAQSFQYRTAPLWGLRFRLNTLLHDGRGGNLDQALLFHGGEGKAARTAYLALSSHDRGLLEAFLKSL